MELTKKQIKVLKEIEEKMWEDFQKCFVETMMSMVPMQEDGSISVRVPSKQLMTKRLEDKFNTAKSLLISGMINKFVVERYRGICK